MISSSTPSSQHRDRTGSSSSGLEGRRSLQEPVLSSVEDEELDMDTPMHDTGASYTGAAGDSTPSGTGRLAGWAGLQDKLARYVGEQPGKAALLAVGAGALAALVLGQRVRGRRRRN